MTESTEENKSNGWWKTKTIKELTESIEKQKQGYETELASLKEDFEKKSAESSKVIEGLNEKGENA